MHPQFRMYAADTRLDRIEAALAAGLPSDILTVVPVVEDLLVEQATELAACADIAALTGPKENAHAYANKRKADCDSLMTCTPHTEEDKPIGLNGHR